MTAAKSGVGTTLQRGNGASPEVFTTVAEVRQISGPELTSEEVESTSLDSVGGFKEFIGGLKDGGQVQFDCNYIGSDVQQNAIRDNVGGVTENYRISWPFSPTVTCTFAAQVVGFSMSTEPNSAISASVTLKISGSPTWA